MSIKLLKRFARRHRKTFWYYERLFKRELLRLGIKHKHQRIVGPYIVDFCIPEMNLIVEIDGDSHIGKEEYDTIRETFFWDYGFKVLRLPNEHLKRDLDSCVQRLLCFEKSEANKYQFFESLGSANALHGRVKKTAPKSFKIPKVTKKCVHGRSSNFCTACRYGTQWKRRS